MYKRQDLDRGFSVVDYNLNEELATIEDLSQLKELGIDLKPVSYTHLDVYKRQGLYHTIIHEKFLR